MNSNWQPIRSAPLDGNPILAVHENNPMMSRYVCWRATYDASFPDAKEGEYAIAGADWCFKPTHWLPLPRFYRMN